ncbi:LTA synthase family protein [Cohnella abietis]|uniref:Sulfatase N-terminal domain-containing protein n=1 Tax=Cohnella abietis TaxID=2507935 RepID=A0A3T1CZ11_9BACL|nr:LTA synthase family protein [Cohnella abietis]BBI31097.1 hypothetical protein KCTCHS21_04960 [Cohnella abietis]
MATTTATTSNGHRGSVFILVYVLIMLKMMLFRHFIYDGFQLGGIWADMVAVLALICIVELVTTPRWKGLVFGVISSIISLLLFASTVYFNYYSTVPIYTALQGIGQVGQIGDSIASSIEITNYLYFLDIVVLIIYYAYKRFKGDRVQGRKHIAKRWHVLTALAVCLILSGFYIKSDKKIANELVQAESLGFLNYQITAAIKVNEEPKSVANENEMTIATSVMKLQDDQFKEQASGSPAQPITPKYFGVAKGKNVIVIQMEAFQNFAINLSVNGQVITPVLNSLSERGFYFPHFFQQIGQGNTSDAEFMSNASIYPTGVTAMSKGYGDRTVPSLPRLLKKENYVSNTFHVNDVTFWDRDKMYPALGFDHYYDKPFYENDNFNGFGASDIELYKVGVEKLKELNDKNVPFYAQFITASSHHPFKVPAQLKRITMPESLEGTQLGNYLTALNYTDYAIGQLIEDLKANGMWDDTILVIYGDHFGLQPKDNDVNWVGQQLGIKYNERVSRFNIPLIVNVPGVEGEVRGLVGGQVDIMPTIANLLGISLEKEGFTAFGHDLFNIEHNVIGMRYYLPTGSFFNDEILFVPGKGFDDGTAVNIRTLQPVDDFSKYRKDYDYIMGLLKLSDKYAHMLPHS